MTWRGLRSPNKWWLIMNREEQGWEDIVNNHLYQDFNYGILSFHYNLKVKFSIVCSDLRNEDSEEVHEEAHCYKGRLQKEIKTR